LVASCRSVSSNGPAPRGEQCGFAATVSPDARNRPKKRPVRSALVPPP
jgi:hypothetical protein